KNICNINEKVSTNYLIEQNKIGNKKENKEKIYKLTITIFCKYVNKKFLKFTKKNLCPNTSFVQIKDSF
ncbi:MAG: hypothetical protein Q4F76_09915, partial [Lachnospiraceae bacterium]|nr:hypothetical protein [Lachnospiraceae bacterium]